MFLVLLGIVFLCFSNALVDAVGSQPRVLLLTAHPDDECFFFAPTILALRAVHDGVSNPAIFSLCLSTGNADGLGKVRQDELARSLDVLGIEEERRWVVDHPALQDNFTAQWDADVIANVVRPYVVGNKITTILTFDKQGVSSHPNHFSLSWGASRLISSFPPSAAPGLRLFTLITVPVLPKYTGVLSALLARLDIVLQRALDYLIPSPVSTDDRPNVMPVFVSGIKEYITAAHAITVHKSQLVWFRYLYMGFSRYMWVNEWVEVRPDDGRSS
ncbi:LmbE-like protein [Leucogyrophana mollusca]|uniref:LmbE-like protein n=1 Tax=Leucogyrophana mollusca TaxID=85980 RepID=A0ACB8B8E6_9AGAM|nr:LmbE-like protein [Leucogyrophana mollusca]